MILKVCGMRDSENIRDIEQTGIDWMGFIFYSASSRYVPKRPEYLPKKVKRVGVFVDESMEEILSIADLFQLDYIQLHGHESPDFCHMLETRGLRTIKAFPIATAEDFQATIPYSGRCTYFLFDTKTPAHGGSGQKFDWGLLDSYRGNTPFLLSGGIGVEDTDKLKTINNKHLIGFDINSRFESTPGLKQVDTVRKFVEQIKKH